MVVSDLAERAALMVRVRRLPVVVRFESRCFIYLRFSRCGLAVEILLHVHKRVVNC